MPERITDEDRELLDDLGVESAPVEKGGRTAKEQRIIAGFEEIERFVQEQGRLPRHGEDRDIFERLYAVRLDRLRESDECREVLREFDTKGLLRVDPVVGTDVSVEAVSDEDLLADLGVEAGTGNDVRNLEHVRPYAKIKAAEEIAQRTPCADFAKYKPLFEKVRQELKEGTRQTRKFGKDAEVKQGDLFILEGQTLLVTELGEEFISDYGRPNKRLKIIYDNGTESEPLLRSLQRALYEDKTSRRISEPGFGPLFADVVDENDQATGSIYVLRSKSDHPFIAENRLLIHKIGVTGGDVKRRIAGAKKDPTYLLADVEVVAKFDLSNIDRKGLEALLHRFFGSARLDMELKDRFNSQVEPKEWFLVPLPVIDEVIQKIIAGTIGDYRYDPQTASLQPAS
jgi:hypothetical protein